MANVNKVFLVGNVTRIPERRSTPGGKAVTSFGLACNRKWTDDEGRTQEEVTFVDVVFFGKAAETIDRYVMKGDPLFVEGRLKLETWQDKKTGEKRQKLGVVGTEFQFLGGKRDGKKAEEEVDLSV